MGWASGSQLAEDIWFHIRKVVKDKEEREQLARKIIGCFEDYDCDTMREAETLHIDANIEEEEED